MRSYHRHENVVMSGSDKRRIYMLIVAFFAILGFMWHFRWREKSTEEAITVTTWRSPTKVPVVSPSTEKQKDPPLTPPDEDTGVIPKMEVVEPPSIVIDPPDPSYKPDPEKILAQVEDQKEETDRFVEKGFEPEALAYLLWKVQITPPDAPERKQAPKVTFDDLRLSPEDVKAGTHALRGKWVRLIGTLRGQNEYDVYIGERVEEPGPSGVYWYYLSYVFDKAGKLVWVYTVRDEPRVSLKDDVQVEGVFFKWHGYLNKDGGPVAVPVIIADRLEAYERPPRATSILFDWVVPALLIVGGVALVLVMVRGGTQGLGSRRRPHRRRKSGAAPERPNTGQQGTDADEVSPESDS